MQDEFERDPEDLAQRVDIWLDTILQAIGVVATTTFVMWLAE